MYNFSDYFNNSDLTHLPDPPAFSGFPLSGGLTKNPSLVQVVSSLPFEKKVELFWENDSYLKQVELMEKKALRLLNQSEREKGAPITRLKEEDKSTLRKISVQAFLEHFFENEKDIIINKLFEKDQHFSIAEHRLLFMFIKLFEKYPECLDSAFGREFQDKKFGLIQLLEKDLIDCADVIGKSLSNDAENILTYGIRLMHSTENESVKDNIDLWVSKWLDKKQLSNPNVQLFLMYYLHESPIKSNAVFQEIIPHIQKLPEYLQKEVWEMLFIKTNQSPELIESTSTCLKQFFSQCNSEKSFVACYDAFRNHLPEKTRAEILGNFSPKILKRYWNSLYPKRNELLYEKIQVANNFDFLGWYLFQQGSINAEQMTKILEKLDLKKYRHFFFSDKKILDSGLLKNIANLLSSSSLNFWKWVRSFRETYDFESRLAQIYPEFSEQIRNNPVLARALNRHFDLVYHLACLGDTSSLSSLKKKVGSEVFWNDLTKERENKISGFTALCHLGKKGLLKLIADLPTERQKQLFLNKNSHGKSALDECRGSFFRMVQQDVFEENSNENNERETSQPKVTPSVQATQNTTATVIKEENPKALFPRKVSFLPACERDLEKYRLTNPELYQEVQQAIEDLATMSAKRMCMELRSGLKNNGPLKKSPCIVRDIRGNNYRLGFKVAGNADKNQGKIVFLFFWTHEEYNTRLCNTAPLLAQQALNLIRNIPTFPIPTNDGNSGS